MLSKHRNIAKAVIIALVFSGTAYTYAVYSESLHTESFGEEKFSAQTLALTPKQGFSTTNSFGKENTSTETDQEHASQANTQSEPTATIENGAENKAGQVQGQAVVQAPTTAQPLPKPSPQPTAPIAQQPATPSNQCAGNFSTHLLCLINQYRTEKGLGKITANTTLSAVALSHSNWMNTTGSFSHEGLNGSRMSDRCATAGIQCLAENLAYNVKSPEETLSLWKQNAGHNKNLLGPYTTAGIGISGKYLTLLLN